MKFIFNVLFSLSLSILLSIQAVFAADITNLDQLEVDNLNKTEKSNDKEKTLTRKINQEDIFGDEQTFPFVAGLGKNAAH
tara:strand:+ start:436 stop:675 length:240 start_codon:yes stop_codon:yes gene_type:complete